MTFCTRKKHLNCRRLGLHIIRSDSCVDGTKKKLQIQIRSFQFFNQNLMNKALVSDAQLKLEALLIRAIEVVPFSSDAECDVMFQKLVKFSRSLLAERDRLLSIPYSKMTLERLVESGSSTLYTVLFFFLKISSTELESRIVAKALLPAIDTPVKRERNEIIVFESKQKKDKRTINYDESISWNAHLNPNVTEIVAVEAHPLKFFLLARPSGQGKHTPVACYAMEQVLIDLDTLEKQDKTEQQRRRRILGKMKKALIKYTASEILPSEAKTCLEKTGWGMELIKKLRFDE